MAMRWRGVRRGGEEKRTALNTRSPTRPTGTLFPCKFCLLSGSPSPFPSLYLPPSRPFSPSRHRDSRGEPLSVPSSFTLLFRS